MKGFEMVLLFDWEPAEALEDVLMCSGYWPVAPQSSECVGDSKGGGRGKASGSLARCRICELKFHPLGRRAMGDEQCLKVRKAALEMGSGSWCRR